MKLENQVTSLELSKKLKELGVKQDGLFKWVEYWYHGSLYWEIKTDKEIKYLKNQTAKKRPNRVNKIIQAYTCSELGNLFPKGTWLNVFFHSLEVQTGEKESKHIGADETEVNARAKMLINLKESIALVKE